jgi:hypothetical protein
MHANVQQAAAKADKPNKSTASWILTSTLPNELQHPEILPPSAVPTEGEEGIYTGIYTVVVALISLSGGTLNDSKLERYLKRVHLDDETPVEGYDKPALLIKRMEKDGYIVRVKETGPSGEEDITWILGSRAKVEIGDDGVRGLTKAVFNQPEGTEAEELEKRIARSLGVGDRPADRQQQAEAGAEPKRRGRRRRDEQNGDDDDNESDDD